MSQRSEPQLVYRDDKFADADEEEMIHGREDDDIATSVIDLPKTATLRMASTMSPTLPTGELVTAKNTLQSFDTIPRHGSAPSATVIAVAVDPEANIAYAELSPERVPSVNDAAIDSSKTSNKEPLVLWYKRRSARMVFIVAACLITLGVGLLVGITVSSEATSPALESPSSSPVSSSNSSVMESPTSSPVSSPESIVDPARVDVLTSYINNITLSKQSILATGTSPESKALAWMIINDTTLDTEILINMTDESLLASSIGFKIRQRYALLVMWFQQRTINWAVADGWLVNSDECNWYGILCEVMIDEISGENQRAVTQILLYGANSYIGGIPADVGLLSYLKFFEISNTNPFGEEIGMDLTGSLPESIGLWTALTHFNAAGNHLTGPLPYSMSQWTDLAYFSVSGNDLTGTLSTGISQWTAVTGFHVSFNGFSGTIPDSFGQWTALTGFTIYANSLTGTIPESVGQWTALTDFDSSYNMLVGTIPQSIGNWSLIETADFGYNQFSGTMPNVICPYIALSDFLSVDCTVNCSCCSTCTEHEFS